MNGTLSLLVVLMYDLRLSAAANGRLTAVHSGPYARQLYQKLRNKDTTLRTDPASLDPRAQQSICNDIMGSGFFTLPNIASNEIRRMYRLHGDHGSASSSHSSRSSSSWRVASDEGTEWNLRAASLNLGDENTFTCALQTSPNYPYCVSAEYHVGELDQPYMPGRFIFGNFIPGRRHSDQEMILAETPAIVHGGPDFNVEIHYLEAREGRRPAEDNGSDPLCRLVSERRRDPGNQHYRFCVAVYRSSAFKELIRYPQPLPSACDKVKISFKTEAGKKRAAGRGYHERMTLCYSTTHSPNERESFLYISRAYASNAVYIYGRDPQTSEVYLKGLGTNVNIVDEVSHSLRADT